MVSGKYRRVEFMKKRLGYLLCIGGMVLLVLGAFYLPQMIFAVQDKMRMEDTKAKERSNWDVFRLDASYEQNTNARLEHFLKMQEVIVTPIEYEFTDDSELRDVLEQILKQGWFAMPYDISIMTTYVLTADFWETLPMSVLECKKYLLHGRDYQEGVALIMWYLDLYLEHVDTRVRILADSETNTIYYVKITEGATKENKEYKVDKNRIERLYYWADSVPGYYEYYSSYYESDEEMLYHEYGTFDSEKPWFIESKTDGVECCEVTFPLYYGELNTDFQIQAETGQGIYPNLTLGISAIGEKIPEMMQN